MDRKKEGVDVNDTLFLKGSNFPGQGKTHLGDCIKCQRVLMILKLKNKEDLFTLRFVDEKTKQTDSHFKELDATMLPVLVHNDLEYQDADEIAQHLEKHFPDPPLETGDIVANGVSTQATLMSRLVGWLKNKDPKMEESLFGKLHKTLGEIDHTLGKTFKEFGGPFICGPDLKFPDCILLPKLYHAKVAALCTKDYDFTKEFQNIAEYLKNAQKNSVFKETCPSEKEIQEKWRDHSKRSSMKGGSRKS